MGYQSKKHVSTSPYVRPRIVRTEHKCATSPECRNRFLEGGELGKSWSGTLYRTIMLENVSVDVVEGARVKGVLGVSVRPRRQGRG